MLQKLTKLLGLLFCVALLWVVSAQFEVPAVAATVDSGACGADLTWTLDDQGTLNISGTGAMNDYAAASNTPWYSYRDTITDLFIGDGITTIGDRAFYSCTELVQVTIGSNVTTIGSYAFRGCTKLASIALPESITLLKNSAFRACTSLTFVALEGNAPEVENYVFNDGASSHTIQYPDSSTGYDVAPWTEFSQKIVHVGTWITTITPTCTTDGSRYIDCTYCQATFTEVLPAAGHRYVDSICTVCSDIEILYRGTCGSNLSWTLNAHGILNICGSGAMANYSASAHVPWNEYFWNIKTVIISEGITSIGSRAFADCTRLQNITIPESITRIGTSAFSGCSSLQNITIPESVTSIYDYAFYRCSSLQSITIPESVTSIGEEAFADCTSLQSITIPESVTSIGEKAFYPCSSLQNVYISNLRAWLDIKFSSYYSNPMCNGANLYLNNELMTDITLPESVTRIGSYALVGCGSLQSITIPESVTSIYDYAFYRCSSLQSITIPESITSIGNGAFSGCSSLQNITIPESVTSIGYSAFSGCSSLQNITIPEGVTSIGNGAFSGCSSLQNITIPEGITSIGSRAFADCTRLQNITIPESITRIGTSAFAGCESLQSITIPESITSIGYSAFEDCSSLQSITIPESVTSIGDYAFSGCSSLKSIKFMGSAPSFGSNCFYNMRATAYHSCTDTTWTASVKKQYGGNLTWKGHLFGDYVYNEDATCTQNGTQTAQCPECGEEEIIEAPNTAGHSFGNNGYCTVCGSGHDIIINLTDSYGDGWNGCAIEVYADDTLLTTATISSGSSNRVILTYNPSATYVFKWSSGSYSSECSFEILLDGALLIYGKGSNYSDGNTIYTLEASTSAVTLSGSITDFGDGDVTLTLANQNGDIVETLTTGADSYSITAAPGEYILTVSMANHVTRQYAVTLGSEAVTLDVKIHLIGDIDGNGKVNVGDVAKLNGHIKGTAPITDEYQLLCANINGGKLNMGDTAALYSHIRGTKKLY